MSDCTTKEFINLALGDDLYQVMQLIRNDSPQDLSLCTAITMSLYKDDDSLQAFTLAGGQFVIVSALLGQISLTIPSATSALLKVVTLQDLYVTATINSKKYTYKFDQAFSTYEKDP